jgi:hypothetical protein
MNNRDQQHDLERMCERWIDNDATPATRHESSAPVSGEQTRRDMADHQLVDALLQSLAQDQPMGMNCRVDRVMASITAERFAPRTSDRRSAGLWSLVGLAACLLIIGSILTIRSTSEARADELLAAIHQVALVDTDRLYHVFHSSSPHDESFEFLGKLYLRGTIGFVLQVDQFAFGRYGKQYWMVPPEGPVVTADDFNWLESPSAREMLELELLKDLAVTSYRAPLMQVSTIIELIEGDYDVAVRQNKSSRTRETDELIATRKGVNGKLPASIRMQVDPSTKIVHSIELSWSAVEGNALSHHVRFVLGPTEAVTEAWYAHTTHHASDRPVERADAAP